MTNTENVNTPKPKSAANLIVFAILLLAVLSFLFLMGRFIEKQKAIESVSSKRFTLSVSTGPESFSLEQLIKNYNFYNHSINIGRGEIAMHELTPLPWTTQYLGGKYVVGCQYNGHVFSFETDTINITAISDDAKTIFNLQNVKFTEPVVPSGIPSLMH